MQFKLSLIAQAIDLIISCCYCCSMKLSDYLKDKTNIDLARRLGVHASMVSQWKNGVRPIPLERVTDIEKATSGMVSRKDLRPDDWHRYWPELAESDKAVNE